MKRIPERGGQNLYNLMITLIVLFGVVVRSIEYWAMGSMWYDELAIALNVTKRDWHALLLQPLEYAQVAPKGFLALEKLAESLLGDSEAAFRFFPFLFSILSLVLFWRVTTRYLSRGAQVLAILLFAASRSLMMYAKEAKPYAGDVAAVLLLILLAIRFREGRRGSLQMVLAGFLGALAILVSFPAVMTACALGLVLLIYQWKEHQPLRPLAWLVLTWTACSLIVALISLLTLSPGTNRFMLQYWHWDFMPPPWRDLEAFLWLPGKIFELLAYAVAGLYPDSSIEFVFVGIFAALMLIGVQHLVRQEPKLAALLFVPLIAGVCASALYILPLASRIALYVAPTLLIAAVAGVDFLHARSHGILRQGIATGALTLALTTSVGFLLLRPPPHRREEARPVLREMSSRWMPGDEVYALDGARLAMEYYGSRFGLSSWIQGDRHDGDFVAHLREVDALRGNERAWLFYTHAGFCEKEVIRGYLETIGVEIDRIEDPYGNLGSGEAAAFLYNLSDPERLERSSPEAFSIDAVEWCRRGAGLGEGDK